ncbi:MAG: carbon-nitrogen hydrolase family protein [Eggerthellaceae bacterium]|jgi:predicted amidohydrolase
MEDELRIAVASLHPYWGDKEANLHQILGCLDQAANKGAQLVVLPELCLTGYDDPEGTPFADKVQVRLAETVPGPSSETIAQRAHERNLWVVFGMPECTSTTADSAKHYYNAACIVSPNGIVGTYRKIHPFGRENEWADAGDEPCLIDTPWGPIGIGICYDLYSFPEMVMYARAKGARLFLNPTAAAWTVSAASVFREKIEVTCLRGNLYIATANLQGTDLHTPFVGQSHIIGPLGPRNSVRYFAGLPFDESPEPVPGLHIATLDLGAVENQQSWNLHVFETNPLTGRPDWRPDLYARWFAEIADDPAWRSRTANAEGTDSENPHA